MTDLPPGWTNAPLGEIVDVLDSQRIPVSSKERARRTGCVPYYGATGQLDWIDEVLFNEDLILLGEDGVHFFDAIKPKAYRISGPAWVNNHAHVLRVRQGLVDQDYLLHFLNYFDYRGYANGTTRLKLTQAAMNSIPVLLPPLAEQRRIVAVLEEHLYRLESAEGSLVISKQRSRQLKTALVERAVQGHLSTPDIRDPTAESELQTLFERRATRVAKRRLNAADAAYVPGVDLPTGWTVASVDQLSWSIEYGSSAKTHTSKEEPDDIPVLRMGNIQEGSVVTKDLKYLRRHAVESFLLTDGDLLFNRTNSAELVGKAAVYREGIGPTAFASYLIRCRLVAGVEPGWLSLVINSSIGRTYVKSVLSQQVGQANVNGTKLAAMPILLPPVREQRRLLHLINDWAESTRRLTVALNGATCRADVLRRSLLTDAFAGRLVVQNPSDEPASELLARIRAEREAQPAQQRTRRARTSAQEEIPL